MCLGAPAKILHINGLVATVDVWGLEREVRLDWLHERVRPGDYVIEHVGYAVRRIADDCVSETLGLYEVILSEAGEDPVVADLCCELSGRMPVHA